MTTAKSGAEGPYVTCLFGLSETFIVDFLVKLLISEMFFRFALHSVMVCSGKDATRIRQISFDCCYLPVHSSPGAILDEAHFRFNTGSFCLEDAKHTYLYNSGKAQSYGANSTSRTSTWMGNSAHTCSLLVRVKFGTKCGRFETSCFVLQLTCGITPTCVI